ncbi:MAG: proline dehydrogenase family protein [Candidatus Syntropharchaeia archaeon]
MRIKKILIDLLPEKSIVFFAAPYVAGEKVEDALKKAVELYKNRNICSTIDYLGESLESGEDATLYRDKYLSIIDGITEIREEFGDERKIPSVSCKPSSLCADLKERRFIEDIVRYAKEKNVNVTIDMEDLPWVDFTLDLYRYLREKGYDNVGTVLQTKLHRTYGDIERMREGDRIRICIGVYPQPENIALQKKRDMKARLVEQTKRLLEKGVYTEIATHDRNTIEEIIRKVIIPDEVLLDCFEFQWLLGVPMNDFQDSLVTGRYFDRFVSDSLYREHQDYIDLLREEGLCGRCYVPFAPPERIAAYGRRRLLNHPEMMRYILIDSVKRYFQK